MKLEADTKAALIIAYVAGLALFGFTHQWLWVVVVG